MQRQGRVRKRGENDGEGRGGEVTDEEEEEKEEIEEIVEKDENEETER